MGAMRAAVTAVLMLTTAATAVGQCVSEVRVLSTRNFTPNMVAGPAALGGGVLAVAKYDRPTRRIFVGTYDERLNPLRADVLVADSSDRAPLALLWNGQGFGLFYVTRTNQRLVLQRLTTSGDPLGTPIPVSSRVIGVGEEVDIVWSPVLQAYVIATTYSPRATKDVWITQMDRDGIVSRDLNTFYFGAQEQTWLNVAVTSDGVIGVFYAGLDEAIVMGRVDGKDGAPIYTVWSKGRELKVVASGNRFYLVKQVQNGGKTEIRWLILDSAGAVVAPDRLLVAPSGIDVVPMALVINGGELALTYLDAEFGVTAARGVFNLRRFTTSGAVIADTLFAAPEPVHSFAFTRHDPIWTGSAYVTPAAYEDSRELTSVLLRLCPLQARITTPRRYVTNDEFVTFTAVAEGGVGPYTYRWNSGNASTPYTGPTLRFRYLVNGTYTVTLTVTDSAGMTATATYDIRVIQPKTRAARK